MMQEQLGKVFGIDISSVPIESVTVFDGMEPKYKCKIPFIQKILTKMFGMKAIYKTVEAKRIEFKAGDYPIGCGDAVITFGFTEDVLKTP